MKEQRSRSQTQVKTMCGTGTTGLVADLGAKQEFPAMAVLIVLSPCTALATERCQST